VLCANVVLCGSFNDNYGLFDLVSLPSVRKFAAGLLLCDNVRVSWRTLHGVLTGKPLTNMHLHDFDGESLEEEAQLVRSMSKTLQVYSTFTARPISWELATFEGMNAVHVVRAESDLLNCYSWK
jgi:hypothetical protein